MVKNVTSDVRSLCVYCVCVCVFVCSFTIIIHLQTVQPLHLAKIVTGGFVLCVLLTLNHPLTDCPVGTYGENCDRTCSCGQGSDHCDVITGCVCLSGWGGINCDRDVNECDSIVAQEECQEKNAECFNYQGGYRCHCQKGYVEDGNGTCQGRVLLRIPFWCVGL